MTDAEFLDDIERRLEACPEGLTLTAGELRRLGYVLLPYSNGHRSALSLTDHIDYERSQMADRVTRELLK